MKIIKKIIQLLSTAPNYLYVYLFLEAFLFFGTFGHVLTNTEYQFLRFSNLAILTFLYLIIKKLL